MMYNMQKARCVPISAADMERFGLQELRRRGVDAAQAEAAMDCYEPDWESMEALLDKRLHGDLSDRKEVNKAVAALQRRGFVWEDIRTALNRYGASLEAEWD